MLVSEIQTRVKRSFGDESGAQLTDADILRWINDGQKDIAIRNQLVQVTATVTVVSGTSTYSLTGLARPVLALRSVAYDGIMLRGVTLSEADTLLSGHDLPSATLGPGRPAVFWVWAGQLNVYPPPDNSTKVLKIYYTAEPTEVTAGADTPELPVSYHPRLVEYCLAQAYELDENWTGAGVKAGQLDRKLAEQLSNTEWAQRDFYPSLTVSTEDAGPYAGPWA